MLNLEDRVVPAGSLDITMLDAVGYTGKTIAVKLSHSGTGSSAGSIDWGDGSPTTSLSGWSYGTSTIAFTHSYTSANTFKITATDTNMGNSDNESLLIRNDVAASLAVDAQPGMEYSAYATTSGNNPSNTSAGMVRYADGVIDLHFSDLESTGFGMPFGITRSWSNGPGYGSPVSTGNSWNINQIPTVTQVNSTNTLAVVIDGNEARTFDLTSTANVYQERFFGGHQLTHDTTNQLYVLTTPGGVIYKFADFTGSWTSLARGTFESRTDPNGNVTQVASRSSGIITEITRGGSPESGVTESWVFANDGARFTSITLRRKPNAGSYTNYRKVEYDFYDGTDAFGNQKDLKTAIIKDGSNNILSTQYYRYYKPGEADGFWGALKMYVGFASYERADATLDPLTAADSALAVYADLVFKYDRYRRVTEQKVQGMGCSMCSAGVGEYTFSYTASSHGAPAGVNRWAMKTTETLPDGNQNIVYTNAFGQVMQFVQKDGGSYWRSHYVYDGLGKLIQKSNPSATTNVNESFPELVISNGARLGLSPEFQVNTYTTGHQRFASVARDDDGDSVTVWASNGQDGSGYGIYAQRFNAVGQPQGSEFRVNTYTTDDQRLPTVAMSSDGDFVVVWSSDIQDSSTAGVYGQLYDQDGTAVGSEFRVNSTTTDDQTAPVVAMDSSGDFTVAWMSGSTNYGDIYARQYNSAGTALAGEFLVNSFTTDNQQQPSISCDDDGDFVIAWSSLYQDGSNYGVYAQRFNSSGVAQGSEFRVSTTTIDQQFDPAVTMDADGDFVIAWNYLYAMTDSNVFIQRYNSSGVAQGSNVQVNSYTTLSQSLQSIASNARGDFMVTWTSNGEDLSSTGVFGRFYLADGTAGSPFQINTHTTGSQTRQNVASDYDGNFIVAWESDGQDGSSNGIFARPIERRYSYISDTTGLVERYHYSRISSIGSTTSTANGSAGDIAGLLKSTWILQGEIDGDGNDLIKQSELTYYLHSDGTNTASPLATSTVYRGIDGTGGQTTTMGYAFAATSLRITEVTVTHPVVTTAQNGPNSAVTEYAKLDSYGRTTWTKDGGGFLVYREYDDATGAVIYTVNDVNTTSYSSDYTNYGSAPWSTASGLRLRSNSTVDFMGRVTIAADPNGNETYIIYNDPGHEVRVYPGWDKSTKSSTGPTQVYREDWARSYTEVLTMSATPNTSSSIPLGTEAISSLESLSRSILNNAGQRIYQDDYFVLDTYSASTVELTSGDWEHYRSETQYAARGGVRKEVTPNGTITRYIRDALNRVIEVWIGTDDTATGGTWPSVTTDTDMVKVYTYTYDSGGVGDGNLTKVSADPGSASDRDTEYSYDWRNRPMAVKMGVQGSESLSTDTQRPLYYFTYDNLNQITSTKQFDGDNVTITITDGVPVEPGGTVQSRMETLYDDMGRAYREMIYSGSSTTTLTTDTWYDNRGNAIKTLAPGGLVTKLVYDGAGRMKSIFFTDGGSDPSPGTSSNWDHADDRTDDTVYEEMHYTFDSNGNVTQTTRKERQPSASGIGDLTDHDTQPYARVSFTGNYYDKANRLTATADVGTNGNSPWTVSGSPPSRSATELVNNFSYDSAGDVTLTTDPRGIETHSTYDALHRLVEIIEGYDDGTPSDGTDRTTTFKYDGSHHVVRRTQWLNSKDYQQTEFVYGVEAGVDGNEITSNDLLGVILYPDVTTGAPSPAQYQYSYNRLGEVIRMEDFNETVHEYTFDVVGRSIADMVTSFGANNILETIEGLATAYDSAGRAYLFTTLGDSNVVINQVERLFNGFGQMTKEYQEADGAVDGSTLYVEYIYANSGNDFNLETITYSHGEDFDFTRDAIGRVTSSDFEGDLETLSYLGLSKVTGWTVGDDVITGSLTLDTLGRISEFYAEALTTDILEQLTYGYDRNGNVLFRERVGGEDLFGEIYHESAETTDNDKYTLLNQMKGWSLGELSTSGSKFDTVSAPVDSRSYSFDGVGNTTEDGIVTTRVFNRQNQLTSHDSNGLSYDQLGNLVEDDLSNDYAYDAWNRLTSVNLESDRYGYDATGRRNKVGDRALIYDHQGNIIEEYDTGDLVQQNAWSSAPLGHGFANTGSNRRPGRALRAQLNYSGGVYVDTYYAVTVLDGSVMTIVQSESLVLERFVYDPWGNVTFYAQLDAGWELIEDHEQPSKTGNYGWATGWGGGRWESDAQFIYTIDTLYSPRNMTTMSLISTDVSIILLPWLFDGLGPKETCAELLFEYMEKNNQIANQIARIQERANEVNAALETWNAAYQIADRLLRYVDYAIRTARDKNSEHIRHYKRLAEEARQKSNSLAQKYQLAMDAYNEAVKELDRLKKERQALWDKIKKVCGGNPRPGSDPVDPIVPQPNKPGPNGPKVLERPWWLG